MASEEFDALSTRMLRRLLELNPDCATIFGMHDPYDGLLPHGGFERVAGNMALLDEWTVEAERAASSEELSRDQTVSLEVLRLTRDMYRFAIEDYPLWKMRPDALENPGSAMLIMLIREYAPLETRLRNLARRISELPRYLEEFRRRFQGSKTPEMWTRSALESCRAFPHFLRSVEALATEKADAQLAAQMSKSVAHAEEELRVHEEWLRSLLDSAVAEFAMGRQKFEKMLRIRGIGEGPDELLSLASRLMAEFRRERAEVASRMTGGGTVEDARRMVESLRPRSDDDVLERTKDAVARARDFVIRNDIVTVPLDANVIVISTPEFLLDSTATAATYLPAVFESSQDSVYLVSRVRDPSELGRTWNLPAIDNTAVHEAYPGHHLQGALSNSRPWMHQLPHIIYTPETLSPPYESQEGWATYCENMMREKGFLGTDAHAFNQLDYCLWTACRVVSEVRLSCGTATVDEIVDMFVNETGCSRDSAKSDVEAFSRMPGYGICYLLGRHRTMALKKSLLRELRADFSEKKFHDLVAQNGNLPFHLLEREVRHGMTAASS
ncbi:MAG: DUF885 domain-containing protein [Thermoplasmata archaeon]